MLKATESNNVEKHQTEKCYMLDFRCSLESGQPSSVRGEGGGTSASSFPEQRLLIEPNNVKPKGKQMVDIGRQ